MVNSIELFSEIQKKNKKKNKNKDFSQTKAFFLSLALPQTR
jgi:hypothetical protein